MSEDTCRPVVVDGETIRVHGARPMSPVEVEAFADIVRAAKRRFAAEVTGAVVIIEPSDPISFPGDGTP